MVPLSRSMWVMTWWCLIAVGFGLAVSSAATAGTYSVTQTCGAWQPFNNAPSRVAVYTECPKLIARNVGGAFNSGPGQEGRWEFWAPAGTSVERAYLGGSIGAYSGWQATILSSSGAVVENCPGFFCPGGAKGYDATYSFGNSAGIYLRLRCGADRCPNNEGLKAIVDTNRVSIVINDGVPPGGGITGGDLLDGWRRGVGTVTFDHGDNVGIRSDRILVDGTIRGQSGRPCVDGLKYPCPNGPGSLQLDTTRVSDGAHILRVEAVDAAGNVAGQDRRITIDNTGPSTMLDFAASTGWRSTNAFEMSWRNPVQAHAPIAGIGYELCPGTDRSGSKTCKRGSRNGADLKRLTDFQVPGPGSWRSRIWLRDAAGNEDPSTAVEATWDPLESTCRHASLSIL